MLRFFTKAFVIRVVSKMIVVDKRWDERENRFSSTFLQQLIVHLRCVPPQYSKGTKDRGWLAGAELSAFVWSPLLAIIKFPSFRPLTQTILFDVTAREIPIIWADTALNIPLNVYTYLIPLGFITLSHFDRRLATFRHKTTTEVPSKSFPAIYWGRTI